MELNRRDLLLAAGTLAAVANAGVAEAQTATRERVPTSTTVSEIGRRKLGSLEVSSVGLGVQNMSRTYQRTVPTRAEMHNIIRTAFDRGLTFYDAAEAYGPLMARVQRQGRPVGSHDVQIAAIALSRGASVATRNVSDFESFGIDLIDPWTAARR